MSRIPTPPASAGSPVQNWKSVAAAKRQSQLASIPQEWRIPELEIPPKNTLHWLRTSGVLDAEELAITETTNIDSLLSKIRSRELTARALVRAYCKRAALAQQLVGCCTELFFTEALERAGELDRHLDATGETVGPLHGLPVSLKDLMDVAGHDTTWGWVGLINKPAEKNCSLVDVLVRQGAVPYVKTNLSQSIMMSDSYNHVFKQSLNSLNRDLISGGSSGGEGALVGCLGSPVGFGSDTGGSIRIPSHIQGIYGLCPSVGRVSFDDSGKRMFIAPPVVGPMATSLASIETIMDGYLSGEPWTVDPIVVPIPWRKELAAKPQRPLRIGFYLDDGHVLPQPPQTYVVMQVVEALRSAGHEVFDWSTESHHELFSSWGTAIMADGGDVARKHCDLSGEPLIDGMIIGTEDQRLGISQLEALADMRVRHQKEYLRRWQKSRVDVLLSPVQTYTGFRPRTWVRSDQYVGYSAVWNWLGFAALAMPITVVDETNSQGDEAWLRHEPRNNSDRFNYDIYDPQLVMGMPVGIQIVGGRFGEEKAVAAAKVIGDILSRTV